MKNWERTHKSNKKLGLLVFNYLHVLTQDLYIIYIRNTMTPTKKTHNPIKKWAQNLKRCFSKDDMQVSNNSHLKRQHH